MFLRLPILQHAWLTPCVRAISLFFDLLVCFSDPHSHHFQWSCLLSKQVNTFFFDPPSPPARLGGTGSFGPTTRNGQAQKQGWLLEGCHVLDRHWQKKMLRKPGASPFQSSVSFSLNLGHPFLSVSLSYQVCPLVGPCGRALPSRKGAGEALRPPQNPLPLFLWGCQGSVEGLLINFPFSHTSLFQPWASPFEPSVSFSNALHGCDGGWCVAIRPDRKGLRGFEFEQLVRGHPSSSERRGSCVESKTINTEE